MIHTGEGVGQSACTTALILLEQASDVAWHWVAQKRHERVGCSPMSTHKEHVVNDEHGSDGSGVGTGVGACVSVYNNDLLLA